MIYDCFIFHSEFDLLTVRCRELFPNKCKHILVESPYTFTGKEKPLYFHERREEFREFNIDSYIFDEMPNTSNPWENEIAQRNYIKTILGFYDLNDNDTVIITDADEIPRHEAIKYYKPQYGFCSLQMRQYYYYLNCLDEKTKWDRARIMNWGYLKDKEIDEVRNSGYAMQLVDAGFHWSWLGGIDSVKQKLESFSHQELNNPSINNTKALLRKIENGESLDDPSNAFKFVPITEDFPQIIFKNQDYFKKYIKPL